MKYITKYDEIHTALIEYLDSYFVDRNLHKTIKMFSPQLSGFGTGIAETAYNPEEIERSYLRDIEQAPNKIRYTINKLHITTPVKKTGIVTCELDIKTRIMDQELSLNNLRLSIFFAKSHKNWLIEHMHISFPTLAHEGEEAYPIKELEERNQILQRLVDERTETLRNANRELQKAVDEVKTLRGIIPICSYCKKIRADDKSWHLIETYIKEHSEAEFSHGICPDCAKKLYPEINIHEEKEL